MDPALVGTATPTLANTVESRFIGRLVSTGANRFNGAFQAGQGINDTMQSGNAFRVSPRLGVVYDLTGEGKTIVRGGFGIFYDRPMGNMVFDQITNAPGMLQPILQWGRLQDLGASERRPRPHARDDPDGVRLRAAARHGLERRRAAQAVARHRLRPRLRRLLVEGPPAVAADQRGPLGRPSSCRRTRTPPARRAPCRARPPCPTTSCGRTRATATSTSGSTGRSPTTTPCRRRSTAGSTTG